MGEHSTHDKRIRVKITNTELFNSFIKIMAQDATSDEFQALMNLKSIFKSADDITIEDIQLGENLYIARLDMDNYVRCRIVEINNYNSIANIDLIDSCCKIKINYNQLRMLPKSSSLYKIPSISNDYVVAELIVSRKSDDYRQKFVKFRELVVNKYLEMEILNENRAGKYVQLYSLEASIAHDIVPNHPTLKSILKRIHLPEQMNLALEQYNNESCQASPVRLKPASQLSDILNFASVDQYPINEKHEVRISSYVKGPKLFYVQSTKVLRKYQEFHINLQKMDLNRLKDRPKISEICLAFLELNNVQRVEIMKVNGNMFKVRLIDHGAEQVVKLKDLYAMPESIASEKPFAWKFALHDIEKLNALNIMELSFYFQFITNNKKLTLVTKSGSSETTAKCSLFNDTNNIYEILKAWNPRSLRYPKQSQLAGTQKVRVVYAESPKLFCVHVCEAMNSHSAFFEEFSNFNGCDYDIPTPNSACYVTVDKKNWRGNIEKLIVSSIYQIKLVDIGITDDFSCKEIKVMVDEFVKVPPLAYKCCLVEYKTENIEKDISMAFIRKCKQFQTFDMNIIDYDGEFYYVSLENELEKKISEEMQPNTSKSCLKTPLKQTEETIQALKVNQPQISSTESSPTLHTPSPSSIIQDWTDEERKKFGDSNLWKDSYVESSYQDFNDSGIITSIISPNDFTIQCLKTMPDVKKILSELQVSAPNECPLTEFTNGTFCIAMNPISMEWCRSVIIDADLNDGNTLVTVRDLDSGQIFSVDNLNELKKGFIFMVKPYFGIRCGLPIRINRNMHDEALRLFSEMCFNKDLRYKIIAMNEVINVCDILVDDKSVTDSLVDMDVAVKLKYIPKDSVYVVHIKNLTEFYVHLDRESQLIENMNHYAASYEQIALKAPIEGMTVMAKSKKFNKWYRAKITGIDGEDILVKYLDFGDNELLSKSDLGMIDTHCFLKQLPLAHHCSLNLPNNLNPESPKAIEEFKKIVNNGFTKLGIRMIEPKLKKSIVMLYVEKDTNVLDDFLIKLCDKFEAKEESFMFESNVSNSTDCESFLR